MSIRYYKFYQSPTAERQRLYNLRHLNNCVLCSCHEKQDLRGVFQTEYIKMHKAVAVCLTKAYMGSTGTVLRILNLGTK
jgi:hypothetical protein